MLQERLPLVEFRDMDDRGAILWRGLARLQGPEGMIDIHPLDKAASFPDIVMPKIARCIAVEAPDDPLLREPRKVQMIFNVLALGGALGTIPPVDVDRIV